MDSYNYESFGQCDIGAPDFRAVAKVGTKALEFVLTDLDGKRVSLANFKGQKHVLLEFGSIARLDNCPLSAKESRSGSAGFPWTPSIGSGFTGALGKRRSKTP